MSEWQDKPWYPGRPTGVVLYLTPEDGWRFALSTDRPGIVDGRLGQPEMAPDDAMAIMVRQLLETDQAELDGEWRNDKPGWWSANLKPVS